MAENKNPYMSSRDMDRNCKDVVCLDVNKVFDSCKDKDCLEDLEVLLTRCGREIVDRAISVKCKSAEILWVYIDVEASPYNKGFYSVDIRFFFKIHCEAMMGSGRNMEFDGLATADKRVILYGSEGAAKIYSSTYEPNETDIQNKVRNNLPKAAVEVVDPLVLDCKIVEKCDNCGCCCDISSVPDFVCRCFDDAFTECDDKKLLVTLGVFSIVRIERNVQLLMPSYDFCIPEKECVSSTDDPCSFFYKIKFPVDEFFPTDMCCNNHKKGDCCQ